MPAPKTPPAALPPLDAPGDAFLEAELDRALSPYRDLLEAEALLVLRATLRETLLEHPSAAALLRRARPLPSTEVSGDYPLGWSREGEAEKPAEPLAPSTGQPSRKGA